jgi:hypothetical protein
MSVPSVVGVYIFTICLIVPVLVYALVKHLWNQPLQNGPGYFYGIEVPAGFYEGRGRSWLKGYHAMLAALYLACAVALGAIVATRRWEMTPLWAGGFALLFVPSMFAFQAWTRHKLGVDPPVRPVALALASRRLGDYISWPAEALVVALVGLSWWLLLRHAGAHFDWLTPLLWSWVALGFLPGKIATVRASWPLPTERTEEHYRYQDAMRRNSIRVMNLYSWSTVVSLFGIALGHGGWSAARRIPWLPWSVMGVFLAVWGTMMVAVFRGERMAATVGRDLIPAGSWRTPFRRATLMMSNSRPYLIWFAIWFGGILAFLGYALWQGQLFK